MRRFSIITLRIALVYLLAGATLGTIGLIEKATGVWSYFGPAIALHRSMLLYGWTLHLIIGVAYWILPTFGARVNVGREGFARASVILLNAGIVGMCVAVFAKTPGVFDLVGHGLIVAGAAAFAIHAWPRIKPFGGGRR